MINLEPFQSDMNYFVDFCYFRIAAPQNTTMPITDKMFIGWSEEQIKGAFQEAEVAAQQSLYCENGQWKTRSNHPLAHYWIEHLIMVSGKYGMKHMSHDLTPQEEYGVFDWAEPSSQKGGFGIGGGSSIIRELYTWKTRPKLEGKVIRRMYQGADYVSAGRALTLGLIEQKSTKKVIWLSIEEHKLVLSYVRGKRR